MSSSRMDLEVAIRAVGLGKRYRIGQDTVHDTLRDALADSATAGFRRLWHRTRNTTEFIWALKDVTLEIRRGEVVGIIGRNGAGKSTLLKLLTRVTYPTAGWLEGFGRVGSLLEVGTGFHPELTGRENIYLSGAVLGMKRAEIKRKFDAIVAFAEIDRFLDTPVKRYSSGMFVRLGFAVAAYLEPDILVIDEVLAVGDAAFQNKCLVRMREIAASGCTVLFVSHNLNSVRTLCQRAVWLSNGRLIADRDSGKTINDYLFSLEQASQRPLDEHRNRGGSGRYRLTSIELQDLSGVTTATFVTGGKARFVFRTSGSRRGLACSFTVYDPFGQPVTYFDSAVHGAEDSESSKEGELTCLIDELMLLPGKYRINAALTLHGELLDHVEGACFFHVESSALRGRPVAEQGAYGSMQMPHQWVRPHNS